MAFLRVYTEVVIPEQYVGDFIVKFGLKFGRKDGGHGGFNLATVDRYYHHQNGWHIAVTIDAREVTDFNQFIKAFCLNHNLKFEERNILMLLA